MNAKIGTVSLFVLLSCISIASVSGRQPDETEIVKVTLDEHGRTTVNGVPVAHYPNLRGLFLGMPQPVYPPELRMRHITGSGIFTMYIGRDGKVTDVKIRKSTGHRELDIQVIDALRQYRTKPGPQREIDMPVTFRLPQGQTYF
jgi:TonB family protein